MVHAKLNLRKLKRKKVITENLIAQIESSDNENAKEVLFEHLKCHADVAALREYCKMITAADAFPNMQKLGEKMLNELPPEGLLGWYVACVCVCVCVRARVHACDFIMHYMYSEASELYFLVLDCLRQ